MICYQVMRISSKTKEGVPELWEKMLEYRDQSLESGTFYSLREKQHIIWMWNHLRDNIMSVFQEHPAIKEKLSALEQQVCRCFIHMIHVTCLQFL